MTMTTPNTTSYDGWHITITQQPYQGGELGDESGYTPAQLAVMQARLSSLNRTAVAEAFPGATIDWRTGGWSNITASYEGDAAPDTTAHDIEAWVRDTLDGVFNDGEWADSPDA